MAKQQEPKKPRRPKSKKLNVSSKKEWERILRDVDKQEVPIGMLKSMTVNLRDGTQVNIDIKELIDEGVDPEDLKNHIDDRLEALDDYIEDVDFYISVEEVQKTVQPATDLLLKNL
jgi:hypothetical protein